MIHLTFTGPGEPGFCEVSSALPTPLVQSVLACVFAMRVQSGLFEEIAQLCSSTGSIRPLCRVTSSILPPVQSHPTDSSVQSINVPDGVIQNKQDPWIPFLLLG